MLDQSAAYHEYNYQSLTLFSCFGLSGVTVVVAEGVGSAGIFVVIPIMCVLPLTNYRVSFVLPRDVNISADWRRLEVLNMSL